MFDVCLVLQNDNNAAQAQHPNSNKYVAMALSRLRDCDIGNAVLDDALPMSAKKATIMNTGWRVNRSYSPVPFWARNVTSALVEPTNTMARISSGVMLRMRECSELLYSRAPAWTVPLY